MKENTKSPELFIGLTGAVGTDLDKISKMFDKKLQTLGYATEVIVLSKLLGMIKGLVNDYDLQDEYARIMALMDAGDKFRQKTGTGNALIKLAIPYVINIRNKMKGSNDSNCRQAYIFKSLKHVKEVQKLRQVYGKNFWLVSVYSPHNIRSKHLAEKISNSNKNNSDEYVMKLIKRDEHDSTNPLGQNVRDTFSEADVFLNMELDLDESIDKFVELLFENTLNTPTTEESGMMHAFTASMASSSLSRQVGASILTKLGDLISTGVNEVPKARGGHYVVGDINDAREWKLGYDSNTRKKTEALTEFLTKLDEEKWLSDHVSRSNMTAKALESKQIRGSAFLNLIEYGREVHAEMSALMSALRIGISVKGCTMYCTTFPCHICAKHIIASGISKLVYIEPYPKSLAKELYYDSITVDEDIIRDKVQFNPFIGVSPRRHMELFRMLKRKDKDGNSITWNPDDAVLRYVEPTVPYNKEQQEVNQLEKILSDQGLELEEY